MPTQTQRTLDLEAVDRLSQAFNRCFETFDAGDDVFATDAFFDLYPPLWRFQLEGGDAFTAQLRAIAGGKSSAADPAGRADGDRLRDGARGDDPRPEGRDRSPPLAV